MCNKNIPLECIECSYQFATTNPTSDNILNYIQFVNKTNTSFDLLLVLLKHYSTTADNTILVQINTVLCYICYHHNEEQIIEFLLKSKLLNYKYDKWYMHYAILNKRYKVVDYLLTHGCPFRPQHLQCSITVERFDYIQTILNKYSSTLGEKIQKSIPEWLLTTKNKEIIKTCIQYSHLPQTKHLIIAASNKNYFLLYEFLQHIGLQLTSLQSQKILEVCYTNLISPLNQTSRKFGIHRDIEKIRPEEKDIFFKNSVEWCELTTSQRYFKYIENRENIVIKTLEIHVSKDVAIVITQYL